VIGTGHARVIVLPALAVAALAGCGSSSSPVRSQAARKPPPSPAHPGHRPSRESRAQAATDRALGARALLRLADFPTGWTASARHREPAQPKLEREIAACLHVASSAVNESDPAEVRSPDFKHAGGAEISNTVTVTPTPQIAAEQFAVFARTDTARCLRNSVAQELRYTLTHAKGGRKLPAGVSFGQATVEQMSFPSIGDQSVAYRVAVSISAKSLHLPLYFDVVLVRAGRAEISLSFAGVLLPTSPSAELALTDLTVRRLDAALGIRSHTAPVPRGRPQEGPV
jgi:hypothetical protein